jgi:hypothetical protein
MFSTTYVGAQDFVRADSSIRFTYVENDSMRNAKSIFAYDDEGREIQKIEQRWSTTLLLWENASRTTQHYSNGVVDTLTGESFIDSTWVRVSRTINLIGVDGDLVETTSQEPDVNGEWAPNTLIKWPSKDRAFPNLVRYEWDTLSKIWNPTDSTIQTYGSRGEVVFDTTFSWVDSLNSFQYARATEYLYTGENLTGNILYQYVSDSNAFFPQVRLTNQFIDDQFLSYSEFERWDTASNEWITQSILERIPNSNGFLAESNFIFYNPAVDSLILFTKSLYTYTDGNGKSAEDTLLFSQKSFLYMEGIETPSWVEYFYYPKEDVTSLLDHSIRNLSIFPNPATNYVQLQGDIQSIYFFRWLSLDGKVLFQGRLADNKIPVPGQGQRGNQLILDLINTEGQHVHSSQILVLPQ